MKNNMTKQKVVRSYSVAYSTTTAYLSVLLNDGYLVVSSNAFIENGTTKYIEYIVEKTECNEVSKSLQ